MLMFLDVGFFLVRFSVNYNDYNYIFITFCTINKGRLFRNVEENSVLFFGCHNY